VKKKKNPNNQMPDLYDLTELMSRCNELDLYQRLKDPYKDAFEQYVYENQGNWNEQKLSLTDYCKPIIAFALKQLENQVRQIEPLTREMQEANAQALTYCAKILTDLSAHAATCKDRKCQQEMDTYRRSLEQRTQTLNRTSKCAEGNCPKNIIALNDINTSRLECGLVEKMIQSAQTKKKKKFHFHL
jgi:hypothetical protein